MIRIERARVYNNLDYLLKTFETFREIVWTKRIAWVELLSLYEPVSLIQSCHATNNVILRNKLITIWKCIAVRKGLWQCWKIKSHLRSKKQSFPYEYYCKCY